MAPDGNLYGVTQYGGENGLGTVFRLATNGVLTTVVSFDEANAEPVGGLAVGRDGKLYGTTEYGGSKDNGTAYCLTTNGVLTTLASFDMATTGGNPGSALVQGPDGRLYGSTYFGGAHQWGTVFAISTNGGMTAVVTFDYTHGARPWVH